METVERTVLFIWIFKVHVVVVLFAPKGAYGI